MEPHSAGGLFSVKFTTVVAGFAGGVVSLSFITALGLWGRATAVFTGAAAAYYLTPLVMIYTGWAQSHEVNGGVAFIVGITAMNIIPGFMRASEIFKTNPLRFIRIRGENDDKGGES